MKPCAAPGCDRPKPRGMGRRYCDFHQDEARAERRRANVKRVERWRKENPERHRLLVRVQPYQLTADEFLDVVDAQDGDCAICGDTLNVGLEIDHDHDTDEVRGLLCGSCNKLIGLAREQQWILEAAQAYLANPTTRQMRECRS